ncbi:MAG: glycosyl transferase [Luteolibacter sp.]
MAFHNPHTDVTRHFCTYFDHRYLSRGLALYGSLREHCPDFRLWVLCLDEIAFELLEKLAMEGIQPIRLEDFLRDDEALRAARCNRSVVEFYFTCTPSLPLYVMARQPDAEMITYLDADLFFFSSPEPLFEEMAEKSISVTPHRFSPELREYERFGLYNVGWLSFRNDRAGLECLHWWRNRCLEWCHDREEDGKFADQKYLDQWPALFKSLAVIGHPGANLAAWNFAGARLAHGKGNTTVNGQTLVFYHFHDLRKINSVLYEIAFQSYKVKPCGVLIRHVLTPYLRCLERNDERLAKIAPRLRQGMARMRYQMPGHAPGHSRWLRPARRLKSYFRILKSIMNRERFVYLAGRVL